MWRKRALPALSFLLVSACGVHLPAVTYAPPPTSAPTAEATFAGIGGTIYRLLDGPTCRNRRDGQVVATFSENRDGPVLEAAPIRIPAGRTIYVLRGDVPAAQALGDGPHLCAGILQFTPEPGHSYLIAPLFKDNFCSATVKDRNTLQPPPTLTQVSNVVGYCMLP